MFGESTPFYLAINNMIVDKTNHKAWYKASALGKNRLGDFMKNMAQQAGIKGRFVNHSVRKTSITNLLQAGVPPTLIKNISGHKNVSSISHYASASKAQVKQMNEILLNPSKHLSDNRLQVLPKSAQVSATISQNASNHNGSIVPTLRAPTTNISDVENNQTAISGLLPHANLSNCTFNISYSISNNK